MLRDLALGAIRVYQMVVSPYLGSVCRHEPTCSRYAGEAITRYGLASGVRMAAARIGRCRPLGTRGYDPVP